MEVISFDAPLECLQTSRSNKPLPSSEPSQSIHSAWTRLSAQRHDCTLEAAGPHAPSQPCPPAPASPPGLRIRRLPPPPDRVQPVALGIVLALVLAQPSCAPPSRAALRRVRSPLGGQGEGRAEELRSPALQPAAAVTHTRGGGGWSAGGQRGQGQPRLRTQTFAQV
eukprot:COSAG04_NODE_2411_length_4181_cov_30.788084_2_plen_167_part_00